MPIHFAGSRRPSQSPLARCLALPLGMEACNDNGRAIADNAVLRAALAHFAEYGLGAANRARTLAEDAFLAGDETGYRDWLAIYRTLDRRVVRGHPRRG